MAFVVFAGQSNTGGAYMTASTVPATWKPDPSILIWNEGFKAWAPMQPGVNTGFGQMPEAWGAEVQFALDFRAAHPGEELRILKISWGGTQLARNDTQWLYDWSPASDDELFDRTADAIRQASAAAGGARPSMVFWGQGEEDANFRATSAAYGQNLPAFFAAIRESWLQDPAGKIGFFRIAGTPAFGEDVRAAQLATDLADSNAESFDTRNFPLMADNVHYSAAGHQMIGDAYFQLYERWSGGAGSGGTGNGAAPTVGADVLVGSSARDVVYALAGDDSVSGGDGQDYLRGDDGNDTLNGGSAFDDLHGNAGDDLVFGGFEDDWVVGGKGRDRLFGDAGDDIVYGNLDDDEADGGEGADIVRGGQGDDVVRGGWGDDWVSGDRGNDTVSGGPGADIFHSSQDAGLDRVTDFSIAEGDRVQLDPGTTYSLRQQAADTIVDMGGGHQLVLLNVTLTALPAGWIFGA